MLFLTVLWLCLLSEHQAALLQLKRECKEELEKLQVSVKDTVRCRTMVCCQMYALITLYMLICVLAEG